MVGKIVKIKHKNYPGAFWDVTYSQSLEEYYKWRAFDCGNLLRICIFEVTLMLCIDDCEVSFLDYED